jgi:uncharacterized protein YigE (DUF2233 family)
MRVVSSLVLLFVLALAAHLGAAPAYAEPACRPLTFDNAQYTVCTFDTRQTTLALYNLDEDGRPYAGFASLASDLASKGKRLIFAMNAGMYDDSLKPIGLYVEDGRTTKKLNRRSGPGNFHMKPNGVFFVSGSKPGILETEAYAKAKPAPQLATHSGPMLVIDGAIHPRFAPDGPSLKRRNGVGVIDDRTVVFAISESPVNFHSFARLFRDGLHCRNALFFDGTISSLYSAELGRSDSFFPLGPIIAAVE